MRGPALDAIARTVDHRNLLALDHAHDEAELGRKAVLLGAALRAGLPVPEGVALSASSVTAIVCGDGHAIAKVGEAFSGLRAPVAARSSTIDADGSAPSFAGKRVASLAITNEADALESVLRIAWAARSDDAIAQRRRQGISASPRIGVVLQRLVPADCAGALFTRDPISGRDERVIEASWGLGEAVMSRLVTPDRVRVDRAGFCLEAKIGNKDRAVVARASGGIEEIRVSSDRALRPCLDDARIAQLHELVVQCEEAFGDGPLALEFAFANDGLWLLQLTPAQACRRESGTPRSRPISRSL